MSQDMPDSEDQIARQMERLAETLSSAPPPSAASMWWRLNLRMRHEKARRAQQPLIWMTRLLYLALALSVALLMTLFPDFSKPAVAIGLLGLSAIALPVAVALFVWSRSKT
jgi:Na+/proline symporter